MAFLDECVGCQEGGVCYCTGNGLDTYAHRLKCYTRIEDDANYGGWDALGCSIGCWPCLDYPTEIIAHAAAGRLVGGGLPRFLLPGAQDARGMMHELVAHSPHLVQQMMEYHRAANHDNYGHECVDVDDVPCDPWPWVEFGSGTPTLWCRSTVGIVIVGSPISGYFGDAFFYHGTWPQTFDELQCRRFPDEPLRSTTVRSRADNTIFLTSASQGGRDSGCGADWLIPGAGYVTSSSCRSGFEHVHEGSEPELPSPIHTPYASHSGAPPACQHLFDYVSVVSANPEFKNREGVDPHDVNLHNAILRKVRKPRTFERGGGHYTEFDRLDHEANTRRKNAGLGRFSRTWNGTGYDIMDSRLPIVRSYPNRYSRTKWFNVPVTAQLVIVKVWFVLDMALPHTKTIYPDAGTVQFVRHDHIEPHCVVRIYVWLGLRVTIDENEHGVEAVYTEGQSGIWPDITPEGNELLLAQKGTQWQWPPAFVEWRGVLNNASNPTLHGQDYPKRVGDDDESVYGPYGRTLKNACTALGTWYVPGTPVEIDRNPDDPNQHWIGEVGFNFTNTDNYRMCVA